MIGWHIGSASPLQMKKPPRALRARRPSGDARAAQHPSRSTPGSAQTGSRRRPLIRGPTLPGFQTVFKSAAADFLFDNRAQRREKRAAKEHQDKSPQLRIEEVGQDGLDPEPHPGRAQQM